WIFYLAAVKYLISPIEEVAPESVREMRIKKQLNDIEIARQKVQEDYRLNKSSAEQLAELGNKSQETNTKPLSEEDINNQLQALDKLRNK
ncbi:MAG: hypothetical protein ABII74_08360, partial [Elusimicrobiota bacterium]